MIMADIPDDMVFEILTQLPVLSLLRFKCASKKLSHLIDSPYFVKSHLKLSNKSHSVMVFLETDISRYVDLDSVLNANSPPLLKENGGPWGGNCRHMCFLVGVCNGLFCVYKYNSNYVFLWNPSTRKHVHFEVPQHLLPAVQRASSWGFGYDSDSEDYKVVVRTKSSSTKRYGFWVYSLKSDLWKGLEECPYLDWNWRRSGVFVNGALHWLVSPRNGPVSIVALDLGNFHWRMLDPPKWVHAIDFSLEVLDGCLHGLSFFYGYNYIQIWVMNEYGVKESWKRIIWDTCFLYGLRPLAYLARNGRQMLFSTSRGMVVVYDFETSTYKGIDHWPLLNLGRALVYIPTLVNP